MKRSEILDESLRLYYVMNSLNITEGRFKPYYHPNGSVLVRDYKGRFSSKEKLIEFIFKE